MSERMATVIIPTLSAERCRVVIQSLENEGSSFEMIVVDNRDPASVAADPVPESAERRVLVPGRNLGYSAAVNLAAREAKGDSLVLLNDDCSVDPGFVSRISAAIDPANGVTMAAGVMRQAQDPETIDSAGMELDSTLLVFDYLNGRPLSILDEHVADPVGPSGAAAAFDREAFLEVGGFDENLFAYWEDVDLVLRLREVGGSCRLVSDARGTHQHSMTLGSGSAEKNRLMGFGRGYVMRKWSVPTFRRFTAILARDVPVCIGQLVIDRTVTGISGRIAGLRSDPPRHPYPKGLPRSVGLRENLGRRLRRRMGRSGHAARSRSSSRASVIFHTSLIGGPVRSLGDEIRWMAGEGPVDVVVPSGAPVDPVYRKLGGTLIELPFSIVAPGTGGSSILHTSTRLIRETRMFRSWFRTRSTSLVFAVTTVLPSAVLAAWLERVPVVLYAAEIPPKERRRGEGRMIAPLKRFAMRSLIRLESKIASEVIVCSPLVASMVSDPNRATVHYPPIDPSECSGDGAEFRASNGIGGQVPLIVCIGSISRGRGQDVLVAALPRLLDRFPQLRVVINGAPFPREQDLAYSAELDEQIRQLGLEEVVLRRERTESLGSLLSAADVVVNPATTYNEGFGRVAFEAGLAGTPMVASARGAVSDLHLDGETILLVPPSDSDALGRAVERLIADPELGARIAAGSAGLARELASPDRSLAVFREVINAAKSRTTPNR